MIVTSKRVFINVLAQFMTPMDLLNASYYIVDVNDTSGSRLRFDKEVIYHDDGTQEIVSKPSTTMMGSGLSRFNIIYGDGWLDPTWAINQTTLNVVGVGSTKHKHEDPVQVYVNRLEEPATIIGVRDWLYGKLNNPNRGRGLRILIINDEDIVKQFGHVMCCYLSEYFGEDITFLDPKYRPQLVKGQIEYRGNRQFSNKILHDLGDYDMMMKITGLISQGGYDMDMNNLTAFLECMKMQDLFYVYEKLFPYEPLPAGNYTKDQITKIITGKCAEKLGVVYKPVESSLNTINMYMDQIDQILETEDL
jgi:hypothetical protein